ncbi:hypothetical protein [Lutibacter sp.]|uniref:hypothetical protein n=1 Tax=Lutibacter sp. TaxID=1925666 RepID=UPI0034A0859F
MEFDYEKFYVDIIDFNGVCRISIPKQIIDGANWKPGDRLLILAKKIEKKEE